MPYTVGVMCPSPPYRRTLLVAALLVLVPGGVAMADEPSPPDEPPPQRQGQEGEVSLVPDKLSLSATVRRAIKDELLTESERNELRLFHGQYEDLPDSWKEGPRHALARWDLLHPALAAEAEQTPALIRAEAAVRRGDLRAALELLEGLETPKAVLMRGRALAGMGHFDRAVEVLTPLREMAQRGELTGAEAMTAGAEAVAELARLEGRPARDYQFVMNLLSRAQQVVDRLHWPAITAQARLLAAKDNPQEAAEALQEALRLNPNASEAWYLLGRLALDTFNFDAAWAIIFKLRDLQQHHLLADILETELYLKQKDPRTAERSLLPALVRHPNHRRLMACAIAVSALKFDKGATDAAMAQFDAVAGQHPLGPYVAGKYLSAGRQYEAAEAMLRRAIERQPNWPQPLIELGLLLNQAGKNEQALAVLRAAADLDPFNKRAANVLKLHERLAEYHELETEHFVIRYGDPLDAVLARDMAPELERIHGEIAATYREQPARKTQIEILSDKRWFAVRITGMPWIWTIGAATGPIVAMTPPREGSHQSGPFDWDRVIRHEYTHTITLSATSNRIPHWFTEACAVSQEPGPRRYETCQLLAKSLKNDDLFDLDEINWAFVRPKEPSDRSLAYAQSRWMYQYITEEYGHEAILKMLELAGEGVAESRLIPEATGQSPEAFLEAFKEWAGERVASWGLAPDPPSEQIVEKVRDGEADPRQRVKELLPSYPDHPDLLRLAAQVALEEGEDERARTLLLRYADARPVDPWTDEKLAELAIENGEPAKAIPHLEQLDRLDQSTGEHAERLMKLHRRLNRLDEAQHAAKRALFRRPYDPQLREAAATIALQREEPETALHHVRALTLIEPDRAIHFTRLAALLHRLDRAEEAAEAARKALELNEDAPVDRFLGEDQAAPAGS